MHKQPTAQTGQTQTLIIKTLSITKRSSDAHLLQTRVKLLMSTGARWGVVAHYWLTLCSWTYAGG
jgi:hypothetical protein